MLNKSISDPFSNEIVSAFLLTMIFSCVILTKTRRKDFVPGGFHHRMTAAVLSLNLLLSATLALLLADRGSVKSHALRLQITGA